MSSHNGIRVEGLEEFLRGLTSIQNDLRDEAKLWLNSLGEMFLDEVQREIIRSQTVDTRRLLNSFNKGDSENVWKISDGGLELEVGTNVKYAKFANDGHFTIDPSKGLDRRWVPGNWVGDRFEYDPSSSEGMLLKFTWVDGSEYFDTATRIFEAMFQRSIDNKLEQFINARLGGRA